LDRLHAAVDAPDNFSFARRAERATSSNKLGLPMVGLEQIGETAGKAADLPRIERYKLNYKPRHRPNWTASRGELTGYAWIGRFSKLADDAETADCGFVKRNVFFTVESQQGRLAAGELKIWRGVYHDDVSFGLDTFVERGDRDSQSEYNTAHAVATLWGGESQETWWLEQAPFCFGDLCVFERLAIDAKTGTHSHDTWMFINSLLQRLCHRDMAAIVLKALPLEYEGNATEENQAAFERRRRALVRLYQRRPGFEPVSDPSLAGEGWMLKLIKDGAEPEKR
jgi:hypothetical protein